MLQEGVLVANTEETTFGINLQIAIYGVGKKHT